MAELIVKYPDRAAEHFQISRLRVTIGRSARNDLCIPDPFASRVHAEVRNEGDEYFLQDLGSTNGTLYNGSVVETPITLTRGGRIQIGETEIVFNDSPFPLSSGATMITDNSSRSPKRRLPFLRPIARLPGCSRPSKARAHSRKKPPPIASQSKAICSR